MTRERLEQIKDEIWLRPEAFKRDGHEYFKEALPILENAIKIIEKVKEPERSTIFAPAHVMRKAVVAKKVSRKKRK